MDGEVQGEWMRGILSPQRRWPSVGDALSAPRRRSARRPEARRHRDGEREREMGRSGTVHLGPVHSDPFPFSFSASFPERFVQYFEAPNNLAKM
jgi:hypothetical protein